MTHTWLEINRTAFYKNIANIKHVINAVAHNNATHGNAEQQKSLKLGIVLKADAYGHGLVPMAQLAQEHPDIDYLFVASTSDALRLRALGLRKPLCTMAYCDSDYNDVVQHDIDVVVYDLEIVQALDTAARNVGKPARVHLKIDTGMHRLGIFPDDVVSFLDSLKQYCHVTVVGCMTHLCDADNAAPEALAFTQRQLAYFDAVIEKVRAAAPTVEHVHACASGTTIFSKNYSLVRTATNAFGYFKPNLQRTRFGALDTQFQLEPILTWKAKIIHLKNVPVGGSVGYGRTVTVQRSTKIAVVPIGYFDGYPRALSNNSVAYVRGAMVPVIGIVSMNMCMFDVTDVPDISVHDDVMLMGNLPGITADDLAKKSGTINIDILTGLHASIKRIIV
jgi:alanine racemase